MAFSATAVPVAIGPSCRCRVCEPPDLLHPVLDDSRGWWPRRAILTRLATARSSGGRCTMTQHRDLFAALAAPFDPDEVKLRTQAGRQLHYVTARTVMNRLDDVLGPENWWDDFVPLEHSVICRLTIRLPDGTILTKSDAGGYAGMADPGDDDKSGFADAFKRAAVKFGVGRYLYRDGIPKFAREVSRAAATLEAQPVDGRAGRAPPTGATTPPTCLDARGAELGSEPVAAQWRRRAESPLGTAGHCSPGPRIRTRSTSTACSSTSMPGASGRTSRGRMVDWEGEQVTRAYSEACRKVRAIQAMQHATEAALSN